jgi:hypothetical protein
MSPRVNEMSRKRKRTEDATPEAKRPDKSENGLLTEDRLALAKPEAIELSVNVLTEVHSAFTASILVQDPLLKGRNCFRRLADRPYSSSTL